MASADFVNLTAAVTAGYVQTTWRGLDGAWYSQLEKWMTGDPDGGKGFKATALGVSTVSGLAADQNVVKAINHFRLVRYGADTGTCSTGKKNSVPHTRDVT